MYNYVKSFMHSRSMCWNFASHPTLRHIEIRADGQTECSSRRRAGATHQKYHLREPLPHGAGNYRPPVDDGLWSDSGAPVITAHTHTHTQYTQSRRPVPVTGARCRAVVRPQHHTECRAGPAAAQRAACTQPSLLCVTETGQRHGQTAHTAATAATSVYLSVRQWSMEMPLPQALAVIQAMGRLYPRRDRALRCCERRRFK